MIDNLMDLTHETYVHSGSIGQKEIDEAPCKTTVNGDEVVTSRFMENIMPPPFWKLALRGNNLADDVPVDRWQICRFTPPSHVMIEVGVAHAGMGGYDAPPEHKAYSIVVDFITPETETSIWYFWGMARKFNPKDKALTATIREGQGKIFSEDLEMLERQQQNLLDYPERALLKLNIDAGGVQSRKILDRIMAEEQAPAPRSASAHRPRLRKRSHEHMHLPRFRCASPASSRKRVDICTFELVAEDGGPLPAFSRRLACGRASARRPDAPVFAVQRPHRKPPLPDRRAARPGLARRFPGHARPGRRRPGAADQRAATTTFRWRTTPSGTCCWPAASA